MGHYKKEGKKTNVYYNQYESEKIISLMNKDPYGASLLWEDYIERYPKDLRAQIYFASTLISTRNLEKAEQVLNEVEKQLLVGNNQNNNGLDITRRKFNAEKVNLLFHQGKYEELCTKYFVKDKDIDIDNYSFDDYTRPRIRLAGFYSIYITNRLPKNYKFDSYTKQQISNYSDERFLEHIKKHTSDNAYKKDENGLLVKSYFMSDIDIEKLWLEAKKYIPSEKGLYLDAFVTTYVFKYDNCGYWCGKTVDYFIISAIMDTDHFITMCPADGFENCPYVDLNYLKEEINDKTYSKVKQKSRTEIFNERYGLN